MKWNEEYRQEIDKYASSNGSATAVRKFKHRSPTLNESTVQTFCTRVETNLKVAVSKGTAAPKALPKYQSKTGRPCSQVTLMVQQYILAASNRGAVLTRARTISATKALLKKYPKGVQNVDLESSSWPEILYQGIGFFNGNSPQPKQISLRKAIRKLSISSITKLSESRTI